MNESRGGQDLIKNDGIEMKNKSNYCEKCHALKYKLKVLTEDNLKLKAITKEVKYFSICKLIYKYIKYNIIM